MTYATNQDQALEAAAKALTEPVTTHVPGADADVEDVARHLYLTRDEWYDHRVVSWARLGDTDPRYKADFRKQARAILRVVHATERPDA